MFLKSVHLQGVNYILSIEYYNTNTTWITSRLSKCKSKQQWQSVDIQDRAISYINNTKKTDSNNTLEGTYTDKFTVNNMYKQFILDVACCTDGTPKIISQQNEVQVLLYDKRLKIDKQQKKIRSGMWKFHLSKQYIVHVQ